MSLQETIIAYLEERGWYYDWEHVNAVCDDDPPANAIRTFHGWTLPQWGEYWQKPYSDDPKHKNFGKPKSRRYENLKDALWSQLLREEEPKTYAVFFQDDLADEQGEP